MWSDLADLISDIPWWAWLGAAWAIIGAFIWGLVHVGAQADIPVRRSSDERWPS